MTVHGLLRNSLLRNSLQIIHVLLRQVEDPRCNFSILVPNIHLLLLTCGDEGVELKLKVDYSFVAADDRCEGCIHTNAGVSCPWALHFKPDVFILLLYYGMLLSTEVKAGFKTWSQAKLHST